MSGEEALLFNIYGRPLEVEDVLYITAWDGSERTGIVYTVDIDGRIFINYGGIIQMLHSWDTVHAVPEEERERVWLDLKLRDAEMRERMRIATAPLSELLEEYEQNDTFFKWLGNELRGAPIIGRFFRER
ncbi:hypothetical protein M1555_01135 [Patescibacteria group bacterium]|nr:hypothetical protein [Patescibacteria group bacterium]